MPLTGSALEALRLPLQMCQTFDCYPVMFESWWAEGFLERRIEEQQNVLVLACACCRYMYTHGYNISLVDMVDRIASPLVKKFLTALTYRKLDTFPTPADYARALGVCAPPSALTLSPLRSLIPFASREAGHCCSRPLSRFTLVDGPVLRLHTAAPKLKALWESYHDTYNVSTIVVPATPITSRPISDVEPYLTHNGKKVRPFLLLLVPTACLLTCSVEA